MPAKNAATPARISGMCRPLSLAVVPVVRRIKENVSLAVSVLGLCGGDVGAEALVSLGLADRSRIGFGFDGDCLTLGLRYAAELRGDPDRWLAR